MKKLYFKKLISGIKYAVVFFLIYIFIQKKLFGSIKALYMRLYGSTVLDFSTFAEMVI